ncbi:hypothetical protein NCAST_34_04930 [Nocardia asteroides NBRC 15531]|uniref:LIM zinc-binding domain-containing protein n=1 Tax=Nocardia asteroides NBRC 15531 TaxID=1110697 RepID=U5EJB1_NOCAS|nr:hypothetical protein NCAST_34_04930 [Nocardia asteroides NBRC 15531]SFM84312.1 hypothetical protein SAMN05444423_104439 [Nocardia asteroides]VEG34202.1 Uncharacterised protein [Nocardia asteroides]
MQLNQFGALCIGCRQGVRERGGFIYSPGAGNHVLCLHCAYVECGESRGLIVPLLPDVGTD